MPTFQLESPDNSDHPLFQYRRKQLYQLSASDRPTLMEPGPVPFIDIEFTAIWRIQNAQVQDPLAQRSKPVWQDL